MNLSLWRKYSGFRPFMFNSTMDFCNFMAKKNAKMSFESIFFDALRQGSNVNHSCPYYVSLASILYLIILSICLISVLRMQLLCETWCSRRSFSNIFPFLPASTNSDSWAQQTMNGKRLLVFILREPRTCC